jgi:putative nucleotidyltransferase with HDIG domain
MSAGSNTAWPHLTSELVRLAANLRALFRQQKLAGPGLRTGLHYALIGAQIGLGLAFFLDQAPRFQGDIAVFLLLATLNLAAERWPISIYGDSQISIGFVLTLAIMILYGAPGVVIVAPFEALAGRYGRYPLLNIQTPRIAGRFALIYALGAFAYGYFAAVRPTDFNFDVLLGAVVATATCFSATALLMMISIWFRSGEPLHSIWEKQRWVGPHYAAMGFLGLALASAYIALGIFGIIAFMMPALMMRFAMKQYVDKTAENVKKLQAQNTALQKANHEVRRMSDELRESYDSTLEALVNALDARDQETKGHSVRVSHYMMDIARQLGVKEGSQEWIDMQRGSLLHDVGKIGVSDTILLKPGKLTEEEWEFMRQHPEIGYNMLRQVKFLEGPAEIILAHHERWDGKGYPRGLHEDEIPLGARIFPVVDTFDAMTSDRPYRKAKSTMDALNEILRYSGSQFDPMVVEAFLDIYKIWEKERERLYEATEGGKTAA